MRLVRLPFPDDVFASEFGFGLGCSEEVRGQFFVTHVVKNFLALFQSLSSVDLLSAKPAVETLVSVVLEDGIVFGLDDAGVMRGIA